MFVHNIPILLWHNIIIGEPAIEAPVEQRIEIQGTFSIFWLVTWGEIEVALDAPGG